MALIEKLKNIANAIRSKTNKTEEMTLEQMASEVEGINTLQGLDFSEIYDQEQADELNQYYKDGIEYAEQIKADWTKTWNFSQYFIRDKKLVYLPQLDFSNTNRWYGTFMSSNIQYMPKVVNNPGIIGVLDDTWNSCGALIRMPDIFHTEGCTSMIYTWRNCYSLENIILTSIKDVVNSFTSTFANNYNLKILKFTEWKQSNINIAQSNMLTAESIHYIIQNAVDIADGATARTLTLHATAKTNWQNSEYYEQDLAVLEQKGITIA